MIGGGGGGGSSYDDQWIKDWQAEAENRESDYVDRFQSGHDEQTGQISDLFTRSDEATRRLNELGDWNDDGTLNVLDVVGISSQIILTGQSAGGTGTWSDENSNNYSPQSDINDDGVVNILDVVMLVNIILSGEG